MARDRTAPNVLAGLNELVRTWTETFYGRHIPAARIVIELENGSEMNLLVTERDGEIVAPAPILKTPPAWLTVARDQIVEALSAHSGPAPTADELADLIGRKNSGSFKQALASLVSDGIILSNGPGRGGYRIRPDEGSENTT